MISVAPTKTLRPRRFIVNSAGTHRDTVNFLHRLVSRLWAARSVDAGNVAQAVDKLMKFLHERDGIKCVQFWGHGRPGAMCVGDEELTARSFEPSSTHYPYLLSLRDRLAREATIWFRGCQTFGGSDGKEFARAAAAFFGPNAKVLGQGRMIGFNLDWGGAVGLTCGQEPDWPDFDPRNKALKKEGDGLVGRMTRLLRRAGRRGGQ